MTKPLCVLAFVCLSFIGCSEGSQVASSVAPTVVAGSAGHLQALKKPSGGVALAVQLTLDADADGQVSRGDSIVITFDPSVVWNQYNVTCYQNGVAVFGSARAPGQGDVILRSAAWASGSADCTADLIAYSEKHPIGTLDFHVAD
jgi:hypothetical protein